MKIRWFGQAAFLLVSNEGLRVVTDPYDPEIGYGDIAEAADVATVSHEHRDHNYVAGLKGEPQVVRGAGLHQVKGIEFKGIAAFHDKFQGGERGNNTIFCFSLDEVRVCHLGDLGHLLSDKQIAEIGGVDLLLLPVGGRAVLDAIEATTVMMKLKPSLVVPMHFKTEKSAFRFTGVDDFLAGKRNFRRLDSSEFEVKKSALPAATEIVVLKHAR